MRSATVRQSVAVGLFCALAIVVSFTLGLLTWAVYLTLTTYFLSGATVKNGIQAWYHQLIGISLGPLCFWAGNLLSPALGVTAAYAIVLGIVCGGLMPLANVKYMDKIPMYFLGMVAYFAVAKGVELNTWGNLIASTGLGLALGIGCVTTINALSRMFELPRPEAARSETAA